MLNNIKFAFRIFKKDGFYSLLNILGLGLGISCGIVLLLYLKNDLTYDKHHENHERIYRLTNHIQAQGVNFNIARAARELAPVLVEEFPEITSYVRFNDFSDILIKSKRDDGAEVMFYEDRVFESDSTMFSVFTHEFIAGDPYTCLNGLYKAVITNTIAHKYFGEGDPIGKVLQFPNDQSYQITAVIRDLPDNSHLKFDILVSNISSRPWIIDENGEAISEAYWNPDVYTYLMFQEGYEINRFYEKWPTIFEKYYSEFGNVVGGQCDVELEALADIHFTSKKDVDEPQGSKDYLYTFTAIGIFIILLAGINYTNLATARSVNRTGEIGMRKVLGQTKYKIMLIVLTEALLLALLAMIVAIGFCYPVLYLTPFNELIGKNLTLDFFNDPILFFGTLGITILIGFLSGIYPALYIPSVPVIKALKGTFKAHRSGIVLRKALIVVQFIISIFVVICILIMDNQMDYLRDKELGFTKDNILLLGIQDTLVSNRIPAIKHEMLKNPNIISATTAYGTPGMAIDNQVFQVEKEGEMVQQELNTITAGPDYIETLGIELLDGRDFHKDSKADVLNSFLVNEAAVKTMGWGDEAIGKKIRFFHGESDGQIVGVVRDFNFRSLHNPIGPLIIVLGSNNGGRMHLRLKGEGLSETMDFIKETWEEFDPNHPYEYEFLDQNFDAQYKEDETQLRLIAILSYLCIFVSLLGLIGLSAFTAGQKVKEISIRKALGASIEDVLLLFSKDYVRLILIAFVVAVPLANYLVHEWLNAFAYKTAINWWLFVLPGFFILAIALFTVSVQSLKAARSNPVDALRSE
ncbi:ABC transporter permease [Fulvivirgaceae bacterium BMA10]|uniref:ABC transporter permease n=1 Tax=Splendidivirga corallicola TaxID=3051826 RepID=A0ABT8KVA3_9BACT|nr:ABC transporter permease [Fulvivirgaceae bacterium BMA10]